MTPPKTSQYKAYSVATQTVAKTRQIVMLYDGAIRFIKQAKEAISDKRIEDRYKLLKRAADVMVGLNSSIDFENGGEVATTLHQFYTQMSVRILSVNFKREGGQELCDGLIEELKQMRDVWENIDRTLNVPTEGSMTASANNTAPPPISAAKPGDSGITLSA